MMQHNGEQVLLHIVMGPTAWCSLEELERQHGTTKRTISMLGTAYSNEVDSCPKSLDRAQYRAFEVVFLERWFAKPTNSIVILVLWHWVVAKVLAI